jgi:GPI-anchor transamidase subunit GAA1
MHPPSVQPLPLKSGALQGALAIEYPFDHRFESLHIVYDGVNGQLPNLDLFNTAVSIAGGQMGIGAHLQKMWGHDGSYQMRLQTMLRGMAKQGLGLATGAHSSFIPYHVDAITLQTKGHGWQDEMALGRTVESLCRSLNNLLEHLHQSFYFYLLVQANRFVSIGTYLPSAMLIAGNFTIMAIALWMGSGYHAAMSPFERKPSKQNGLQKPETTKNSNGMLGVNGILERQLALPLTLTIALHFLGVIPLYIFNQLPYHVSCLSHLERRHAPRDADKFIVPHHRCIYVCYYQCGPAFDFCVSLKSWPDCPPDKSAIFAHKVLFTSPSRAFPFNSGDIEFLARIYSGLALRAI